MIKTTYTLDQETVRSLEAIARRYQIPKSEAVRRAVAAFVKSIPDERQERLEALDRLQAQLALDADTARHWIDDTRSERAARSRRLEAEAE